MDPAHLGPAEWAEIGKLVTNLWFMVGMIVLFATNMLIGHVFVPSLVASRHLPDSCSRVRGVFYALAIISFAVFVFFLIRAIDVAVLSNDGNGVIDRIFPKVLDLRHDAHVHPHPNLLPSRESFA